MKIGSLTSAYADAGNYSFQSDPKMVNDGMGSKNSLIDVPFKSISSYFNTGTVTAKSLNFTGTVFGTTEKVTEINKISYWLFSKSMKKLWLDGTNFVYFIGGMIKVVKDGKRFNFRDYNMSVTTPLPFIYGASKTCSYTTTAATAVTLNNSSMGTTNYFSNVGYGPAHIQHISVHVNSGTLKSLTFGDKALTEGGAVDGDNILTWTSSAGVTTNSTLHLYLTYEVGNVAKLWYCFTDTVSGTVTGNRELTGEDGPRIDSVKTDQSFSIVTDVACTVTFSWFDSNYAGF